MPRVLFVDDNDAVRDVMTELISAYKYDVVPTETAELAISILESDSSFDILFTDIRLGIGHSGIWLARKGPVRISAHGYRLDDWILFCVTEMAYSLADRAKADDRASDRQHV